MSAADCEVRLQRASGGDSAAIHHILVHDRLLPASADARDVYIEFAATYLEYRLFLPSEHQSFVR